MEMLQQESAYDAELFLETDLTLFYTVMDADAAMFTIIKQWSRDHIGGELTVDIEYILRSTKTGQTLYHKEGYITVNTNLSDSNSEGRDVLIDMVATAINTAMTDKVVAGRKCNAYVLSDMPAGRYSPLYGKDANRPGTKSFIKATVE